ncbi:MAG: hypothetical protein V8S74_03145 [Lachnospirales bacterium]
MTKIIFSLFIILSLTGCKNVRELENRDYVMAIGIDNKNGYDLTMAIADLTDEDNQKENITSGKGKSLKETIENINVKTKGNMYLGHNKAIIISDDFNNYDELINYASKNIELSRDSVIVKAKNPSEIIASKNNNDSASNYIYSYFDRTDKVDLDKLMDYYNNNSNIVIPTVSIENNKLIITK